MFRSCLVLLVILFAPCALPAASLPDGIFPTQHHDFGAVPQGRQLVYLFPVVNNSRRVVVFGPLRSSCGCVRARPLQTELAPGHQTAILVEMDTRRFQGVKQVVIYVPFQRPSGNEGRLSVQANSRDDILMTPDGLAFGQVRQGSAPAAGVVVTLLGSKGWQIKGYTVSSNYVSASVKLVPGEPGTVNYQVRAQLNPDIPLGTWTGEVWLKTNNPSAPWVSMPLTMVMVP
jgi:hypothetical protein